MRLAVKNVFGVTYVVSNRTSVSVVVVKCAMLCGVAERGESPITRPVVCL